MRPVLALAILFVFAPYLCAQNTSHSNSEALSDAPSASSEKASSAPMQPGAIVDQAPSHRFWDRTNVLLFSGVAVFRGLDYASTRNFQARGRTEILIPDDVVN